MPSYCARPWHVQDVQQCRHSHRWCQATGDRNGLACTFSMVWLGMMTTRWCQGAGYMVMRAQELVLLSWRLYTFSVYPFHRSVHRSVNCSPFLPSLPQPYQCPSIARSLPYFGIRPSQVFVRASWHGSRFDPPGLIECRSKLCNCPALGFKCQKMLNSLTFSGWICELVVTACFC